MSSDWPAPFQPVGLPPPPPPVRAPSAVGRLLIGGIVIAIVAVVVIIGVFLWAGGLPAPTTTLRPTATATAIAAATSPPPTVSSAPTQTVAVSASAPATSPAVSPAPSASAEALPSVPPDIAAQINQVVATVPQIRELQPLRPVPFYMISRDQFESDLQADFDKTNDPAQVAAMGRALERLGLLPAGTDLRKQILDLNGGAVAAFYRPDTGAFYIIERTDPFGPLDRVYVAHEYTHALQDQHFDLEGTRITDPAEGDAALAQLSVIEGDATDTMLLWAQANLTLNELIEVMASSLDQSGQADLANVPPILSRQLTFPYVEGESFVAQLQQDQGWQAVDDALAHPPVSTEQILHPEKYASHEVPIAVKLTDVSNALGSGWSQTYVQTMGELNLQVFAAGDDVPQSAVPGLATEWPHSEAAAGWNGDRLVMWEGPGGAWAIGWRLDWDTATDAGEFNARFIQLEPRLGGPAKVDLLAPDQLQIVIANDAATLAQADAALH